MEHLQIYLQIVMVIILGMGQKQRSLLVFLILKHFVNFLGIKKLQEYLLLALEIEKKEKIQVHI